MFSSAENDYCSLVTVNAAEPCSDLDEVAEEHKVFVTALNNFRDALVRRDKRFGVMALFAVLEVQHDPTGWRPHWHISVRHQRVDRAEISAAFRERWPGARRVNVKQFDEKQDASGNAADIAGYALKFQQATGQRTRQLRYGYGCGADQLFDLCVRE